MGLRLLLVDGDRDFGKALAARLAKAGHKLEMCVTGSEAVRRATQESWGALLLETRLADISGFDVARLLKKRNMTRTLPIIFVSSSSSQRDVLIALQVGASDYVVKPFRDEILLEKLANLCEVPPGEGASPVPEMPADQVEEAVAEFSGSLARQAQLSAHRIGQLMAMPPTVSRILGLSRDDRYGIRDLSQLVAADPALTAMIMQRANSSYFGAPANITNVSSAVMRMGFSETRVLVLSLAIRQAFAEKAGKKFNHALQAFWRHALVVGALSRLLSGEGPEPGKKTGEKPGEPGGDQDDDVFAAGLFHDLGRMVLRLVLGEDYEKLCRGPSETSWARREYLTLGVTHETVGYLLARRWRLPEQVALAALRHHLFPGGSYPEEREEDRRLRPVYVANLVAKALGEDDGDDLLEEIEPSVWQALGLSDPAAIVREQLPRELASYKDFMGRENPAGAPSRIVPAVSYYCWHSPGLPFSLFELYLETQGYRLGRLREGETLGMNPGGMILTLVGEEDLAPSLACWTACARPPAVFLVPQGYPALALLKEKGAPAKILEYPLPGVRLRDGMAGM